MHPSTDPYTYLGFTRNADASITRIPDHIPTTASSNDPANPVLTKDAPINQETKTWARLYLPAATQAAKLPIIVYYHGGGFVLCSAASSMFQKFLSGIALEIPAVIVSVDYRLAPEHRLPAAYDDCAEALRWVMASDDEWLTGHADMSKCYIMGTSSGGNIVYYVWLREAARMKIEGLILHHPFFGGVERSASEMRLVDDAVLPACVADLMWSLALPLGFDRDHEFCNPVKADIVEKVKVLVTGCGGDPLIDRQIEVARMLAENGVNVIQEFSEGGFHGVELFDDSKALVFYELLKNFISNS
ncbi:putative carboxylesterase 120 [Salvia divinorum]|uniref:Carboxylesterase 120 n=1 Tax=Salvia divinorum TaxID=28513 RepID=A0ABD1HJ32_SALDI